VEERKSGVEMREQETFVKMKDVSSKNVSRKKKQAMFPRVYAAGTTSKPKD
jgi:hypothetical protein